MVYYLFVYNVFFIEWLIFFPSFAGSFFAFSFLFAFFEIFLAFLSWTPSSVVSLFLAFHL